MYRLKKKNPFDGNTIERKEKSNFYTVKMVLVCGTISILTSNLVLGIYGNFILHHPENQEGIGENTIHLKMPESEPNINDKKSFESRYEALLKIIDSLEQNAEEKMFVSFYSSVYSMDPELVYQIISDLTDQFQDEAYTKEYRIGDSILKNREVNPDSKEMAILIAVRNIFYHPEEYGVTREQLNTNVEYHSDWDYEKQIAYLSEVLGVDKALNYAICKTECGFNSSIFLTKRNPSGIRFNQEFATFPSFTAGFIEQSLELLKYKIDGITSIEEIGRRHTETDAKTWISNVKQIYEQTKEDEKLEVHEKIYLRKKYF